MEKWVQSVETFLSHPLLWGVLALLALSLALSGRLSVNAAVTVLWVAWAAATFGIYRLFIGHDLLLRSLIVIAISSTFAIAGVLLSRWYVRPEKPPTLAAPVATPAKQPDKEIVEQHESKAEPKVALVPQEARKTEGASPAQTTPRKKKIKQPNQTDGAANPPTPPTAVVIEKGGKWTSTDDVVYGPDGRAIDNRGEVDSKRLQVNPANPVSPPRTHDSAVIDQLFDFMQELHMSAITGDINATAWNAKVAQYIRDNVDKELADKLPAETTLAGKKHVLVQCIDLVTSKMHSN